MPPRRQVPQSCSLLRHPRKKGTLKLINRDQSEILPNGQEPGHGPDPLAAAALKLKRSAGRPRRHDLGQVRPRPGILPQILRAAQRARHALRHPRLVHRHIPHQKYCPIAVKFHQQTPRHPNRIAGQQHRSSKTILKISDKLVTQKHPQSSDIKAQRGVLCGYCENVDKIGRHPARVQHRQRYQGQISSY